MTNRNKIKGSAWEYLLVELLNSTVINATAKRIPASGAMGTTMHEPLLQGDIKVTVPGLNKPFRIECKTGYGGVKELTVKREWINKIMEEAKNSYSYPALACKFAGARKSDGVQYFVILDYDTFSEILNYIGKLSE
jgi:Holliday junction resolvase